jgi:hypothetical protein
MWDKAPAAGNIEIANGKLGAIRVIAGEGKTAGAQFQFKADGEARLELQIKEAKVAMGAHATLVTVQSAKGPFSFFLRDVDAESPIYIPEYHVIVTEARDGRAYANIAEAIRTKGLRSPLQQIEAMPEETYEDAAKRNRNLMCPTWLGLSRDMRIFRVAHLPEFGYWGMIQPTYHSTGQTAPATNNQPYTLNFCIGPGASCRIQITRRLEDGVLPILHSEQRENDVVYHLTAFATLETQPLSIRKLRGSEWRACYPNSVGNMLKPEEKDKLKSLLDAEMRGREEEVVCCVRVEAVNTGRAPRYAWFKAIHMAWGSSAKMGPFDGEKGAVSFADGRTVAVHRVQGRPMPQEEMAILLPPGARASFEILVPHQALSSARAKNLLALDIDRHLDACRAFWKAKLAAAAAISVPEPALDERIRAGLLHCDLVAFGQEPDGDVLATIGVYAPIGSESSPIIQFFDSMGWHKLAERSLNFFFTRQREDGFIQNFGGYQLETGPALWTAGEHYRYTRDDQWVRKVKPKLLKACEFLLAWRERNKRKELRGRGYGLLDGKVADPEDFFHSFMLNGVSYVGIQCVSEMLEKIDPKESKRLAKEAKAFRADIRTAFSESVARSPVIPFGDGTWVPTSPPWAEYPGPVSLYAAGGNWFTHGAFGGRDSLIGALYLVISEVLDPAELATTFLLRSHQVLQTVENAGMSQPYYCRHDYTHIKRGEVKPFLKTYYNQFTALQDRETYTFWEHYFYASQHKTHEEGWFLMQTRWMLFLEEGDTLSLLRAIPRRWLENGKKIELSNVATHFGPVSLAVESKLAERAIRAVVTCKASRRPRTVVIRLPHPEGLKATGVQGGVYDAATESVRISSFKGRAEVVLTY